MVYIHGGAFIMGDGASYFFGPNYLLENDVVFVTFNFRLGVFGFLATEDKAATGNFGLMDQIMVLKWVQKNIEKFGGDPNKVSSATQFTLLKVSFFLQYFWGELVAVSQIEMFL